MHATLTADAHVAAGHVCLPGPRSGAHVNPLKAATPPVLAGRRWPVPWPVRRLSAGCAAGAASARR